MTRHILHVIAPAGFGGLERVVHSLAAGQRAEGNRVSVVAFLEADREEPEILALLRRDGVDVIPIALPPRAYVRQVRALRSLCRRIRADVVHSHGYVSDVLLSLPGSSATAPRVSTVHGFTGGSRKNRLYEWMQQRAFRRFDAVVAVSAKLGKELVGGGIPAERVHVIPNAYAPATDNLSKEAARSALGIPPEHFSIGWVGRVSREKGLDVLLEALPLLSGLKWHLTVLGDGSERSALEQRAAALAIDDRIQWRGVVAGAGRFLPAFDVLVMSSRTEGTPIVLFEAMATSVPIVASAVGGIPDVVSVREAILVPPEDAGALAVAIRSIHDEATTASTRAERARERLGAFTVAPFVARYDDVYASVSRQRDSS
jgi:glycosyltransferase involved in cell wall biosynthesis